MVSASNIMRSLTYLQDQAKGILMDARGERRRYDPDDDNDMESGSFWKFYREIMPYMEEYAVRENNEEIKKLVGLYLQYFKDMEEYQENSASWFSKLFFSSHDFRHQRHDEEYIRILQNIYNNLSNLVYQVKINS